MSLLIAIVVVVALLAWLGKPFWSRMGKSLRNWKEEDEQIEREEKHFETLREQARREVEETIKPTAGPENENNEKNQI